MDISQCWRRASLWAQRSYKATASEHRVPRGHVLPCEYPTDQRGAHLHWEFRGSSSVPVINGGSSASTNSVAGEFSASGSTLRAYYQSHGGWGNIGWTIDLANGLNMFPNAKWGRMQDFQHHPDGFGGQNNTIHVPAWNPTQAYLVDSTFWAAWAGGAPNSLGALRRLDMAL